MSTGTQDGFRFASSGPSTSTTMTDMSFLQDSFTEVDAERPSRPSPRVRAASAFESSLSKLAHPFGNDSAPGSHSRGPSEVVAPPKPKRKTSWLSFNRRSSNADGKDSDGKKEGKAGQPATGSTSPTRKLTAKLRSALH